MLTIVLIEIKKVFHVNYQSWPVFTTKVGRFSLPKLAKQYLKHANKNRTFFILALLINRHLDKAHNRYVHQKERLGGHSNSYNS